MTLLLWTLAAPLLTALLGVVPFRRRLKEANLVAGLAATLVLAIATARRFLLGSPPSAFREALRVDALSALVLVLGILVHRIVDRFETMDVSRLSKLKG